MKREEKQKIWHTAVVDHDPEDRQADGRWEGTITQKKALVKDIR